MPYKLAFFFGDRRAYKHTFRFLCIGRADVYTRKLRGANQKEGLLSHTIDEFQINEINVDLRTSVFDNEVLSVDACAV